MRVSVRDTFEVFLEHFGIKSADFGLLSLRGEENNQDNKFTLKVLNGSINVYTNADKSAVYLELDLWTKAIFISIGGSNLSPVKVDIDKSTLTLIKPS